MRTITTLLLVSLLFIGYGCDSKGIVISEKTSAVERGKEPERDLDKIVMLDPAFNATNRSELSLRAHNYYIDKEEKLRKQLISSGNKQNIDVEVFYKRNPEQDPVYYNELIKLKQEIFKVHTFHLSELDNIRLPFFYEMSLSPAFKTFSYNPKLSSQFSHLADEFDTPYFSIMGFTYNGEPYYSTFHKIFTAPFRLTLGHVIGEEEGYFFHIMVNVEESEIVYRELREITTFDNTHINSIIYDSLNIVKNL